MLKPQDALNHSITEAEIVASFQGIAQDDPLGLSAANISPCGVIAPQADFFKVKNIKFFNYDFN